MAVRIQFRRGTSTEWSSVNPVLADGELGFETNTKIIKFGDGVTAWNSLPVAAAGDITAVIAGTGLLGGATSGQATLAIDPSYVITADSINAAGDLIVGAGPDIYARLPIGDNGSVLVADSSQTIGVRWAAPSSAQGAVVPTGTILPFAGATAPAGGFLICNGAAVSRSQYSDLFGVISVTYGAGDGSSTFNIPDLRGRVPAGFKSGDTGTDNFGTLAGVVGSKTTVLTGATPTSGEVQIPGHAHSIAFTSGAGAHDHSSISTGNQSTSHNHSVTFPTSGGGHNHNVPFYDIGGSGAGFGTGPVGSGGPYSVATTGTGNHTHSVTVGNQSASHSHTLSITNSGSHDHAATISNALPTTSTLSRIPPSLVINYIVKT